MQYRKAGEKESFCKARATATIINTGVRVKKKGNVHALTKKEKHQLLILRQKHSYRGRTKAARSALCTETVHKLQQQAAVLPIMSI